MATKDIREFEENLEFLILLQQELNAQPHDGQAAPRYWSVKESKREWGIAEGYEDGTALIYFGENLGESIHDVIKSLRDNDIDVDLSESLSIRDVLECLFDAGYDGFQICRYKNVSVIHEDSMFLTKSSCQEHIKKNGYHYSNPRPYAMTAWRNPEYKRLLDILKTMDWQKCLSESWVEKPLI